MIVVNAIIGDQGIDFPEIYLEAQSAVRFALHEDRAGILAKGESCYDPEVVH